MRIAGILRQAIRPSDDKERETSAANQPHLSQSDDDRRPRHTAGASPLWDKTNVLIFA